MLRLPVASSIIGAAVVVAGEQPWGAGVTVAVTRMFEGKSRVSAVGPTPPQPTRNSSKATDNTVPFRAFKPHHRNIVILSTYKSRCKEHGLAHGDNQVPLLDRS